jgi:hypothetical protein
MADRKDRKYIEGMWITNSALAGIAKLRHGLIHSLITAGSSLLESISVDI